MTLSSGRLPDFCQTLSAAHGNGPASVAGGIVV